MIANHVHNPVTILLRVVGGVAMGLIAYGCWGLMVTLWRDAPLTWSNVGAWDVALYALWGVAVAVLLAVGSVIAWTAIRAPSRTHLAITVCVGTFWLSTWIVMQIERAAEVVLTPTAYELIDGYSVFFVFMLFIVLAVPAEWWLARKAGFIELEKRWWSAGNIRGLCVALAWIAFFSFIGGLDALDGVVVERYRHEVEGLLYLGLIAGCIVFAKAAPVFLMKLTGVPDEPAERERSKRSFRLY